MRSVQRLLAPVVIGIVLYGCAAAGAQSAAGGFQRWVAHFRGEALTAGVTPATFDRAFAGIEPLSHVIELDQHQPEVRLSFTDYIHRLASPTRRRGVREHLADNRRLLDAVRRRYGVDPRFIVALWGIETNFGQSSGDYPVIASLATLAYHGRRARLFTRELIAALKIVQRDDIAPADLRGSWAGAMGQCQFMPTSFLHYAVSFDHRGRPDIWHSRADIFASIANYLVQKGWRDDQTWGRFVRVPRRLQARFIGLDVEKPLIAWRRLGLRRADGGSLPVAPFKASLLMPEGQGGPALLVYGNFRTLLRWNNSQAFATAVGMLADAAKIR
ncbi:MAG: lytic murein transglycosylase [Stellaceae bacterium]